MKSIYQYISYINPIRKSFLYTLYLIPLIGLFISCDKSADEINLEQTKVGFVVKNPKLNSIENTLTEITALVFIDNGSGFTYNYQSTGRALTLVANDATSFKLDVFSEKRPVKIYFITNANSAIMAGNLQFGDTETQIKQKIIYNYPMNGVVSNFPMWGEYTLPSGIAGGVPEQSISLSVLPTLARFDLKTTLASTIFSISTVQAFRVNSLIQVVPNSYVVSKLEIDRPSVPTGSAIINTTPVVVADNLSEMQVYLPESLSPEIADVQSKATCIVVGGKYNNSSVITYYRIDVLPPVSGYPAGQILRDHLYTFNITNVSGDGWKTPDEAAQNIVSNIQVDVEDWTDTNIDIDLGGNYYVNISSRNIEVGTNLGSIGSALMFTNVYDYTLQWCDQSGTPLSDSTPSVIIENDSFQVTALRNVVAIKALKDNPAGSGTKNDYFLILARRTRILMTISQLDQ